MADITMYTTGYCPFCNNAERLLESKGVTDINKIRVDDSPELMVADGHIDVHTSCVQTRRATS